MDDNYFFCVHFVYTLVKFILFVGDVVLYAIIFFYVFCDVKFKMSYLKASGKKNGSLSKGC